MSGVGKTSLTNTFKNFTENPEEIPQPFLAEDHEELLETQVLEMYESVNSKDEKKLLVNIKDFSTPPFLLDFTNIDEAQNKKQYIKLVDIGGHTQFKMCSSLLLVSSGVALICIDSSSLEEESIKSEYYSMVGT